MIGIIGAMDVEVQLLKEALQNPQTYVFSGMDFTVGELDGCDVVAAKCGVGKVFAALCAQTMILKFFPEAIINTGTAGTLIEKLSVGDVAVSENVMQHDMDTSALGDPKYMVSGVNRIYFPADETLKNAVCESAREEGLRVLTGTIASGDRFVASREEKKNLHRESGAVACEMEGGAIGQVCFVNQVPFVVIRAISDGFDDAEVDYMTFVRSAAERSARVVRKTVGRLKGGSL
ncbi:MAG: 5'-methylthioadenosine/adenosylhomocysteine nucleosidase [Ruminococcaceae bacterium]|nr:5'-methylthioadenosine/adenosylhomocysteine nucleosidase [Oscillospiraceae bacterium]